MTLDIQFKLNNNPYYLQYLHQNSIWYKILTRNPSFFKKFEEKVREEYKLRTTDKIEKIFNTIELFQSVFNTIR